MFDGMWSISTSDSVEKNDDDFISVEVDNDYLLRLIERHNETKSMIE